MWDWLEYVDFSKNYQIDKQEEEYFKKRNYCSYCGLSYSFEYLIKENIINKVCFNHLYKFNKDNNEYCCDFVGKNKIGCIKQCHDLWDNILREKNNNFFLHFIKHNNFILKDNKIYPNILFQMPLIMWIKIMKNKYIDKKKKIPINDPQFSKSIHDILFFKNEQDYRNYISNHNKNIHNNNNNNNNNNSNESILNIQGNNYIMTRSNITSDNITIYVKQIDDYNKWDKIEEEENEENENKNENKYYYYSSMKQMSEFDSIFNYAIIRYNTISFD